MMKKIIFSLAILAAASFSMMAADNNTNSCSKPKTECCKGKECKGDRGDKAMKAFEGLNLTDVQKTKIEELQKARKAEKEALMKEKSQNKGDRKQKEQLTAEQKQQRKAEMQAKRREAKQNYLKSIQAILTPEQYTQFLENNFMAAGKGHGKEMKKGCGHKGDRKSGMQAGKNSGKGQKGSKGNRSNASRSNA